MPIIYIYIIHVTIFRPWPRGPLQALQQGLESVLSTFCHTAKQQARLAYVYLIEVELYIAKEVISFPSVLHNPHYIVAGSGSRMAKA